MPCARPLRGFAVSTYSQSVLFAFPQTKLLQFLQFRADLFEMYLPPGSYLAAGYGVLAQKRRTGSMRRPKQLATLLLFAITALPLIAQTDSARLEGTVQDQSAAVVPNAQVTSLNIKTQRSSRTITTGQGIFVLPALQPGMYQLTVDAPGFRKAVVNALELNVDSTVSEIIKLEVGQATESVMVEAENVAVQTGESQIGRVINLRDISTLPQLA